MRGEEQQPAGCGARLAEGERIHIVFKAELGLRPPLAVEGHDVAPIWPARCPQIAARRKRQIVDAVVTEMFERMRYRIENLDAVTGRHVQLAARRIYRERLRQALAEACDHRIGRRVELQQGAAPSGCPQLAVEVVGHLEYWLV